MKKIAYFACDIAGTFTTGLKGEELKESLTKFVQLLEQIRIKHGADELIFSFFTADPAVDYLFRYVDILKPYINGTTIKLGDQYMSHASFGLDRSTKHVYNFINKPLEITKNVKELQKENEIVWLGYADDNLIERTIVDFIINLPTIPIIYGFIPYGKALLTNRISQAGEGNLSGLISSMENYLNPDLINSRSKEETKSNDETKKEISNISKKPTPKLASTEKYDYLCSKRIRAQSGIIAEEDIDFIVSICKIRDKGGSVPDDTIMKLRILRTKYETTEAQSYEAKTEYFYFGGDIYRLTEALLHSESYKYSQEELEGILYKTSILALSLTASPDKLLKSALKYNIDVKFSPEGFLAHRAAPKNRFYRLCNVHTEKTPSQILYEDTATYDCFGCGQNGNAFDFFMNSEDITFIESVETIAEAFNVSLSKKPKIKEKPELVQKILESLASDYYRQLLEESKAKTIATSGKHPISYGLKPKKLELILPEDYSILDDDDDDENLPF